MPTVVSVLPLLDGIYPLMSLRFGNAKSADVRLRKRSIISIPAPISAIVFTNIWMFSLYALSHGVKYVHCVEPCPDSVNRIEKHMTEWGFRDRANIMQAGVAVQGGQGFVPSTTSVANTVTSEANTGMVPVPLLDVATLLDSLQPRPTYIKCDVEGNEVPLIRRLITSSALSPSTLSPWK